MNETSQFLSFNQHLNIWWDNCNTWIIGVNIQSHFSSSLSSLHTYSPDYPIYCKDGISSSLCLDSVFTSLSSVFTSLVGCFKHHLFFSVDLRLNYLFVLFGAQNSRNLLVFCNWGINVMTIVLPFRSYSSLIDHSCFKKCIAFNFAGKFSLNLNLSCLSNLSPPRNMAQTLLP